MGFGFRLGHLGVYPFHSTGLSFSTDFERVDENEERDDMTQASPPFCRLYPLATSITKVPVTFYWTPSLKPSYY